MENSRLPDTDVDVHKNQRIEQAAEGSRQQHCFTAGPRKRPHDNWRCGNLAHALHESTTGTGCGVSGERSPERFLTFDTSNQRVQTSFGGRGIAVRFPQREVAETFAPNVEVEVVKAGSLFQCAFCTELSIFELARLLCYLQQVYAVSVRLRLLSLGPSSCSDASPGTLYSASLGDPVSNQPRRAVGLARTLQSSGTRVRKHDMAVQEGVSAISFADL